MGSWNGVGQEPKFNTIYDNLFRCMYNLAPDFNTPASQEVDAPIKEALNLLTAASYAKAYPAVRLVIESHLLQFHQLLWYQVEKNPETWASVGCKLQSAIIFREAMIHLAGRYHLRGVEGIRKNKLEAVEFGQDIWELATQKARELKDYKLHTERRLFEFVPPRMLHPAHEEVGGMVTAGRQVYAGDIYWWMCLHLVCILAYFLDGVTNVQPTRFANITQSLFSRIVTTALLTAVLRSIVPSQLHTPTSSRTLSMPFMRCSA